MFMPYRENLVHVIMVKLDPHKIAVDVPLHYVSIDCLKQHAPKHIINTIVKLSSLEIFSCYSVYNTQSTLAHTICTQYCNFACKTVCNSGN